MSPNNNVFDKGDEVFGLGAISATTSWSLPALRAQAQRYAEKEYDEAMMYSLDPNWRLLDDSDDVKKKEKKIRSAKVSRRKCYIYVEALERMLTTTVEATEKLDAARHNLTRYIEHLTWRAEGLAKSTDICLDATKDFGVKDIEMEKDGHKNDTYPSVVSGDGQICDGNNRAYPFADLLGEADSEKLREPFDIDADVDLDRKDDRFSPFGKDSDHKLLTFASDSDYIECEINDNLWKEALQNEQSEDFHLARPATGA